MFKSSYLLTYSYTALLHFTVCFRVFGQFDAVSQRDRIRGAVVLQRDDGAGVPERLPHPVFASYHLRLVGERREGRPVEQSVGLLFRRRHLHGDRRRVVQDSALRPVHQHQIDLTYR